VIAGLLPPDARDGEAPLVLHYILDAAKDPGLYPGLRSAGAQAVVAPLYDGAAAIELAGVAPYLLELEPGERLFEWLLEACWGQGCGVFLWSQAPLAEIRAHLRRLTRVRLNDAVVLFRFYDPVLLGPFLQTCDAEQLRQVFGPIDSFLIETEDGQGLDRFSLQGDALQRDRV
jgi:hypothetical protein